MGIEIQPYLPEHIGAVRAFNQRLTAGGCAFQFPERHDSTWLPKSTSQSIYEEFYVATEDSDIRGGYILKHQPFWLADAIVPVGSLYLPLSEGAVNPQYGKLGLQLLLNALKRQPLLYSLGMGSLQNPYPQLLKAAGWHLQPLPLHFLVLNAKSFCQNITFLRQRPAPRLGLDILAATGLGHLGFRTLNALRRQRPENAASVQSESVREFGEWTDAVWNGGRANYTLIAVRNREALQRLYPAEKEKFLKLKVFDGNEVIGWTVSLDTAMSGHKQFGNMRVASVIDGFAQTGREVEVTHATTEFLAARQADLIVSNQSHLSWATAFDRAGYLRGPSNFIFAASPKLKMKISDFDRVYFTRGDGEGPSHL